MRFVGSNATDMHYRWGLHPRPHYGSLQHFPEGACLNADWRNADQRKLGQMPNMAGWNDDRVKWRLGVMPIIPIIRDHIGFDLLK